MSGRRIASRAFLYLFFACVIFPDTARAQIKDIVQPVGVIEYNVKNHQGGWISRAPAAILKLQVQLIATQVKARAAQNPPVDFIALVQSSVQGKNGDGDMTDGDVSTLLNNEGLPGWTMIQSHCDVDLTQLAYSADWELVAGPNNPLVNSTAPGAPQNGWVRNGCTKNGDQRAYNIAYFNNKKTNVKVLFVITHMPHCHGGDYAKCFKTWDTAGLQKNIRLVLGKSANPKQVHFIMAGDMNEMGASGSGATFAPAFSDFGSLQISSNLETCCANPPGYVYRFDRLLANSPARPNAEILTSIGGSQPITYPLDLNFSGNNEEHKAIFGVVEFAPPAKKP